LDEFSSIRAGSLEGYATTQYSITEYATTNQAANKYAAAAMAITSHSEAEK